ncbi:hypothetical protein LHK12_19595 [Providencia rettgeri]|nr:hypothetical protein [Providencia rettgeri]
MGEATKKYGHTINIYDLSTSNCTTQTVNAIKAGGSKVFEKELSSVRSGYSLARYIVTGQESFVVPASLEDYMVGKKQDLSSLVVIEVTGLFQQQYSNVTGVTPMEKSKSRTLFEAESGAASMVGYHTDFSGEETMGIIGQLLYGTKLMGIKLFVKWGLTLGIIVANYVILFSLNAGMAINQKYQMEQPWSDNMTTIQLRAVINELLDTSVLISFVTLFSFPASLLLIVIIHKVLK